MTRPPALAMEGVTRHFGRRAVLADIALELADGEQVALGGPNGSGKTTLLRIAAGTLRPTAGTVRVLGRTMHAGDTVRHGVGYLPADVPVYAELTPSEHLRWWARLHRQALTAGEADRRLADAGLGRHAHRSAGILSRGQRQRLGIACAFAARPRLLLLDEPGTALDDDGTQWLRTLLETHAGAALIAAHGDAPWRTDRTLRLDAGREVRP